MLDRGAQKMSNGANKFSCETTYSNDAMQISRRWYNWLDFIGILAFVAVFNGVWISNDFLDLLASDKETLLKVFALLFIVIGVSSAYFIFAFLLNKTIITVDQKSIEVRHRPVPWPGNTKIARSEVVGLVIKQKHYLGSSKENTKLSHQILALTRKAEPIKVLTGLKYGRQALHIKQKLEDHLGFERDVDSAGLS